MSENNLSIWNDVEKTDPKFTKDYKGPGGFTGTAVNPMYIIKKCTEIFGPVGIGWGYEILEERFDTGGQIGVDADGVSIRSQSHTIYLKLWYMIGEAKGELTHFGHTPYITFSKKWGVMTDPEAPKKSLTDAIGKCLSMLGFASDVFMGMYDDINYLETVRLESDIDRADNADEAVIEKRTEFGDWARKELGSYPIVPNVAALKLMHDHHIKKVDRQCRVLGIDVNKGRKPFDDAFKKRMDDIATFEMVCPECGTAKTGKVGDMCGEDGCEGKLFKQENK